MKSAWRDMTRREHVLLALGLGASTALALASFANFGNPRLTARAQAAREARLTGSSVVAAWTATATSAALPPGALAQGDRAGVFVTALPQELESAIESDAGPSAPGDLAPSPGQPGEAPLPSDSEQRLFDALFSAAERTAVGARRFDEALALAAEAIDAAPMSPRRYAAHLRMAAWWTQLGEAAHAAPHLAVATEAPTSAKVGGVPVALLARLAPAENLTENFSAQETCAALLASPALLPEPSGDRLVLEPAGLRFIADPLIAHIRERLGGGGRVDRATIDAALRRDERRGAAASRFLSESLSEPLSLGRWTVLTLDAGEVAARESSGANGTVATIVGIDRSALMDALRSRGMGDAAHSFVATFGEPAPTEAGPTEANLNELASNETSNETNADQPPFGPTALPGLGVSLAVSHADPEASAQGDLRRIRVLRFGFGGLAMLTLGATFAGLRALRKERRLSELRSTFVASVSHDLRTPAQAILLLAEALDEDRVTTEESARRYHGQIRREAERLRRLVEDLLDGARIDRGEGPRVIAADVDAAAFTDSFAKDATAHADRVGARLVITRRDLPDRLWLDPESVRRAIWNLFENALLHGRSGDDPAAIQIDFGHDGKHFFALVKDRGPGLRPGLRESAFEPFERLSQRGAKGENIHGDTGTGLGLSIVRAIARAHGGDAKFEDTQGAGAAVRATFAQPPRTAASLDSDSKNEALANGEAT